MTPPPKYATDHEQQPITMQKNPIKIVFAAFYFEHILDCPDHFDRMECFNAAAPIVCK